MEAWDKVPRDSCSTLGGVAAKNATRDVLMAVSMIKTTGFTGISPLSLDGALPMAPNSQFPAVPGQRIRSPNGTCSPMQPGIAPNPQNRNSLESAGSWNLDSVAGGGNGSRGYLICHGDPLAGSCPPRLNIKACTSMDPTLQPDYYPAQYSAAMAYAIAARDDSA